MTETYRKTDDGLEITRVRVVSKERLIKKLQYAELDLDKAKVRVVDLKAKLETLE